MRITEFTPATPPQNEQAAASSAPASGYGPPTTATRLGKLAASLAQTFLSNPMGRSGAQQGSRFTPMSSEERADGSLRVVYAASIGSCRPCPLREQCQWNGPATKKPRQVSVLLHPVAIGSAPLQWHDWSRRIHRRACIQLLRHQRVEVPMESGGSASATPVVSPSPLSRAERAHTRLSWQERLARHARVSPSEQVTIKLFGVPEAFATSLGLASA